MIKLLGIIVGL